MRITGGQLRQIIREELLRETTYRFPTGNKMLRGRTADITYDHGMRQTLDPAYNAEEDMSHWAAIPAAPGSPSDTMGFRDQEEDLLKMDPKVVAAKIIRTWGSEDTLNALDILKGGFGSDEDYHEAMIWLEDMLKTTVRMNPDPYNRNLTPREKSWIERTIGETYRQAAEAEGTGGFNPQLTPGRHFGPKVPGVNETRRISRNELLESGAPQPYYPPSDPRANPSGDFGRPAPRAPTQDPQLPQNIVDLKRVIDVHMFNHRRFVQKLHELLKASYFGKIHTRYGGPAQIGGYNLTQNQLLDKQGQPIDRNDILQMGPSGEWTSIDLPESVVMMAVPRGNGGSSPAVVLPGSIQGWPNSITLEFANRGALLLFGDENGVGLGTYQGDQLASKTFTPSGDYYTNMGTLAQFNPLR